MAEAKTKAQIEAEWWEAWWAEDFTWDGLAKKPLQGWVVAEGTLREAEKGRVYGQPAPEEPAPVQGRRATLQDYWRGDPATGRLRTDEEMGNEIVPASGQPLFHRLHLPLAYKNGTPTRKANWANDSLDALIAPRLIAAGETVWTEDWLYREIVGPDRRARLDGACLLSGFSHPNGNATPLSIACDRTAFLRDASFDRATFSGDADFDSATFSGDARFWSATFSGNAGFERATFSGDAVFYSATFSRDAVFEGATFSRNAVFDGATFSGNAGFDGATFSGNAGFERATFSGDADFKSATFSRNAEFLIATFSGQAVFEGATFSGNADFEIATFSGYARFVSATFSRDADFRNATFSRRAHFVSAAFSGDARFRGARWKDHVRFESARFAQRADFTRNVFSELVWFDDARFSSDMKFTAAVFDKLGPFERVIWPEVARDWHGAFDQAQFRGTLNLKGAGFKALAAFDGATLERGVVFDEIPESKAKAVFRAECAGAIEAALRDAEVFEQEETKRRAEAAEKEKTKPVRVSKAEIRAHERDQREARLRELERGCRVLKQAMERSSNKSREQMFYRFELQARRAQTGLPFGEKTFSYLYAAASDYGASMWRPFAALAVVIAAFAALFYAWSFGFAPAALITDRGAGAVEALDLSWRNVFRPFSALSTEVDYGASNPLAARLLFNEAGAVDGQGLAVRAVSTLQSLFALVLAFLFGLAVRRRFQIS